VIYPATAGNPLPLPSLAAPKLQDDNTASHVACRSRVRDAPHLQVATSEQDDLMSITEMLSRETETAASPVETFIACAHQMLDPSTPEAVRRAMEPQLLAQLPMLRALGVFELFEIRDPALRAWLADEMEGLELRMRKTRPLFLLKQT
jgi:hypothetical protein